MVKITLIIFCSVILAGCSSNKLCGTQLILNMHGKAPYSLNKTCLNYLEDKPIGYYESSAGGCPIFINSMQSITKTQNGFVESYEGTFLFLSNLNSIRSYDKVGEPSDFYSFTDKVMFGLLTASSCTENKQFYKKHESFLTNAFYSSFSFKDYDSKTTIEQKRFFLDAFGYRQNNEDKYLRVLWIDIKI